MFDLMSESMFVATRHSLREDQERLREYHCYNKTRARAVPRRTWHLKLLLKLVHQLQTTLYRTEASLRFRTGQPLGCG